MLVCTSEILTHLNNQQIDSLVELMLLAATADGELSIEEIDQLQKCLLEADELWLTSIDLEKRMSHAQERIHGALRADRLAVVKRTLESLAARKAGLELAIRVVAADGIIRTSERELILETAEALDVDREVVADMVKAIAG